MRHLDNLEFEIEYRIRELIGEHGLMPTDDPRAARLFKNLTAIKALKQTTYQPRYRLPAKSGRSRSCFSPTRSNLNR
jgi:hypothetical protein